MKVVFAEINQSASCQVGNYDRHVGSGTRSSEDVGGCCTTTGDVNKHLLWQIKQPKTTKSQITTQHSNQANVFHLNKLTLGYIAYSYEVLGGLRVNKSSLNRMFKN